VGRTKAMLKTNELRGQPNSTMLATGEKRRLMTGNIIGDCELSAR